MPPRFVDRVDRVSGRSSGTVPASAVLLLLLAVTLGCGGESGGAGEQVIRHNNVGTALLSQQKWGEAAAEFRAGLELRADDPLLLNNAAVAVLQQGETDAAQAFLRRAVESDPSFPYAHYNLGLIERNLGNFEPAVEHFRQVAAHDPDDVFTQYNLGATLARLDRAGEAETALRRALELNPTHVSSLYALGRLLVQAGHQDEGVELITRSQAIRARSGLDEAVGTQYGEQGPYAMGVDYPADTLEAPAPLSVRFVEPEGRGVREGVVFTPAWTLRPEGAGAELMLALPDELRRVPLGAPESGAPVAGGIVAGALVAGDVDNDGDVDLLGLTTEPAAGEEDSGAVRLLARPVRGDGGSEWNWGEPLVEMAVLPRGAYHSRAALVDRDHDGDLDLFVCWGRGGPAREPEADSRETGCALAGNDGEGRFRADRGHGLERGTGTAAPTGVAFSDIDNDRDVDLLVATPAAVRLFLNERDGTFRDASEERGLGETLLATDTLAVADLDKDGWMDLVLGTPGGPQRLANRRGRFAAPVAIGVGDGQSEPAAEARVRVPGMQGGAVVGGVPLPWFGAVVFDHDNDGFLDVAATGSDGGLVVWRNLGRGRFEAAAVFGDGEADLAMTLPLAAADADGDGDLDLAVFGSQGLAFLRNDGGNANAWLAIDPRGAGDNARGIGTKVELLAGALRQKLEVTGPLPLHLGLGSRERVDAVRLLWPGGVLQDELDPQSGARVEIAQLDRKGTSCPLLYAWRDGGWRFVTDFLGGCAIGYQHAPGTFSVPDTDEYVLVEGGLDARDETLRLRLNNQLEEVIWFDRAELVVVDHPEGTEVFPNERLMPGPPWPEFRLYASADVRPLARARDPESGRDWTEALRERDRRYVDDFELLRYKGYAEPHALELDLGRVSEGERVVLLLDGWIDYADSSANVAAWQAGVRLSPPRLLVPDRAGRWREVQGRMGFPAGLPKTMTVDLSDTLTPGDPRLRIETNMRIYWDRARVMLGGEDTPLSVTRLRPQRAELRFGGFPAETSPDGRKPFDYDPGNVASRAPWKAHAGAYTAFGDVAGLLRGTDDRFVTTKNGDEIELVFPALGPPDAGRTRTYLLYADGFGKDMDPNSAAASEVGPIPFHGMPVYPYGSDIVPPVAVQHERPPRLVLPAPDGLPGAEPLPLAARRR